MTVDIEKKQEKTPAQLLKVISYAVFGGAGGTANYFYAKDFTAPLISYYVPGIVSGTIGAIFLTSFITNRFKADRGIIHEWGTGLACGFYNKLILGAFVSIITLPNQVNNLELAQQNAQIEQIETIGQLAQASNSPESKAIAIDKLAKIAETSDSEIAEEAIKTADQTAKVSNPEIKIQTIENLQNVALESEDQEKIQTIVIELKEYTNEVYNPNVRSKAQEAINNITN